MNGCEVSMTKWVPCEDKNNKDHCAFLDNENINRGSLGDGLKEKLEGEQTEYLKRLVNDRAGTGFRLCKAHKQIADIAEEILKSRLHTG